MLTDAVTPAGPGCKQADLSVARQSTSVIQQLALSDAARSPHPPALPARCQVSNSVVPCLAGRPKNCTSADDQKRVNKSPPAGSRALALAVDKALERRTSFDITARRLRAHAHTAAGDQQQSGWTWASSPVGQTGAARPVPPLRQSSTRRGAHRPLAASQHRTVTDRWFSVSSPSPHSFRSVLCRAYRS